MAKLVDALDLGSSGETHQSSSLCTPSKNSIVLALVIERWNDKILYILFWVWCLIFWGT